MTMVCLLKVPVAAPAYPVATMRRAHRLALFATATRTGVTGLALVHILARF